MVEERGSVSWVAMRTTAAVARYNKNNNHVPRIRPVIIEQPMPEPPSYLKRFQFNSKWVALRTAQTHLPFSQPTARSD